MTSEELHSITSGLCWLIISTCSLFKWSKNKLIALSKQKYGWDINLRPGSSRPSLQLSSGTYWVRGHGGKEKAQHTVTVGNLNSCCATAARRGKFPDCMSNLSAIWATACSAVHARESMFVLLQRVQLQKYVREKGWQNILKKPRPVCFMYVHLRDLFSGNSLSLLPSCQREAYVSIRTCNTNWFQIQGTHVCRAVNSHFNPTAIYYRVPQLNR